MPRAHPQQLHRRHARSCSSTSCSAAWPPMPTPGSASRAGAAAFNFVLMSRLIPTVALAVPYYLIVPDARAAQLLLGADRDLLGADAPLHHPGADALLPGRAGGDRRGGAGRGRLALAGALGHHAPALPAEPGRRRALRLHARLQRVPLRACSSPPPASGGRCRSSSARSRPTPTSRGAC